MPWSFFFRSLAPPKGVCGELGLIKKMRSLKIDSMLDTQFWTLGAFKFGAGAAKLSISPAVKKATPDTGSGTESPDYLSERLAEKPAFQKRAVRVPDAAADGRQDHAHRGHYHRVGFAVSLRRDDQHSESGLSQSGATRACGTSFVHAMACARGAPAARWDQPDPEGRLRRLIGSSASIERRAGTGTGLNRCGA
jgi:hypothetical protein